MLDYFQVLIWQWTIIMMQDVADLLDRAAYVCSLHLDCVMLDIIVREELAFSCQISFHADTIHRAMWMRVRMESTPMSCRIFLV